MSNEPIKDTTYWITADNHFKHNKLFNYGRDEKYIDKLKKQYDSVGMKDVVINIGDICIGGDSEINKYLYNDVYGKHILVRGNHDTKSLTFYNKYWDFVCDEFVLTFHGKRILFSHEPKERRDGIDINIHGHLHNMEREERLKSYPWYDVSYHKLIGSEDGLVLLRNLI